MARSDPKLTAHRPPPPPAHLSVQTAALWEHAVETWIFSRPELELLSAGLAQLDVHERAMEVVREEGPTTKNPDSGNVRSHPALAAAHASLRAYRQVLAALDLEAPDDGYRPTGSRNRRPR